jgi:threonine dehydratase
MAVRPGELTFAHVRRFVDRLVTVDDGEIASAVRWLFERAKVVAEPSGAATVAAALRADATYAPTVVAIVSGGNLDPADAPKYMSQP